MPRQRYEREIDEILNSTNGKRLKWRPRKSASGAHTRQKTAFAQWWNTTTAGPGGAMALGWVLAVLGLPVLALVLGPSMPLQATLLVVTAALLLLIMPVRALLRRVTGPPRPNTARWRGRVIEMSNYRTPTKPSAMRRFWDKLVGN